MSYEFIRVRSDAQWAAYHAIRKTVLFADRAYDADHLDEFLPDNHPMLLQYEGQALATVRLDFADFACTIRLVAVAVDAQGKGHGRKLYEYIEEQVLFYGVNTLRLNAAPDAVGYYEKMGFIRQIWGKADLVGIAQGCIQMVKRLLV